MLVLSRKVGERVIINDNITVVVHRLSGNRVALGIEAPPEVSVLRGELRDRELVEVGDQVPVLSVMSYQTASCAPEPAWRRVAK